MNASDSDTKINRILITVNAAPQNFAVFDTAGKLAALMGVDLTGVFVEERDLLNMAALPFARIVDQLSASPSHLDSNRLQRLLRAQAQEVRNALTRIAQTQSIRCDLRIVQGRLLNEALSQLAERDILFLCRGRGIAEVQRPVKIESVPVCVVLDESANATRTLSAAVILAKSDGRGLNILVPKDLSADTVQSAFELLAARAVPHSVVKLPELDLQQIKVATRCTGCSLLVLSNLSTREFRQEELRLLLQQVSCPVVLVS